MTLAGVGRSSEERSSSVAVGDLAFPVRPEELEEDLRLKAKTHEQAALFDVTRQLRPDRRLFLRAELAIEREQDLLAERIQRVA